MRVLIWVQHLRGIGHLRRASLIANALADRGARVTVVSGGRAVPQFEQGRFVLERLTAVRARDASYHTLTDITGHSVGEAVWTGRARQLRRVLSATAPDVIITEHFPFGRRKFRHELLPFLEAALSRQCRPLILSSIRDILEPPADRSRIADHMRWAHRFYDAVLIHGDPDLVRLELSAPYATALRLPLHYTGYVVADMPSPPSLRRSTGGREILVSSGGGRGGSTLLDRAATAARLSGHEKNLRWRLIGGPHGEVTKSEQSGCDNSGSEIIREQNRDDLPRLMASATLSVSRAGYNTVAEALAARIPMILVPDGAGGQQEQTLRAQYLAARGLALHLPEASLTPESLAQAAISRLEAPRPRHSLSLDGARQAARLVETLWREHRARDGMVR